MDERDIPAAPVASPHPPAGAPGFLCPSCDRPLHYESSHAADRDSLRDLTDRYACPAGCGAFEFERRSHRVRRVPAG